MTLNYLLKLFLHFFKDVGSDLKHVSEASLILISQDLAGLKFSLHFELSEDINRILSGVLLVEINQILFIDDRVVFHHLSLPIDDEPSWLANCSLSFLVRRELLHLHVQNVFF